GLALREIAAPGLEGRPDGEQGQADGDDMRHRGRTDARIVAHFSQPAGIPPDNACENEKNRGDDQRRPIRAALFVRGRNLAHFTSPISLRMLSVAATSLSSCSAKASPAR